MASRSQKQMLEAGVKAPAFRLQEASGRTHSLTEILARGPAVLAFFKTTCPVCQLAFPFFERMAAGGGLQFFGVSQDDPESTNEFLQEFGVRFPTLLDDADSGYEVSNAYQISHVPSVFLVEPDGKISHSFAGFSKRDFEDLGARAGQAPFTATDNVPAWKAG